MAQVIIVGGGFAGPVLALALQKHNIRCAIYELRPKGYTEGGNIAIAPNAARVLDHIGIYGRLVNQGFSYDEIAFENGSGHVLGRFLNGSLKEYNFSALRIKRHIVHDELLDACEQRGIPINYNKKFKHVVAESSSNVTVEFEDGDMVTAEWVVGCDGIHSKVRDHIRQVEPEFSGLMGIMGSVAEPELASLSGATRPSLPSMMFGATGSFAIMPSSVDGQDIGYFATIEATDRSRQEWARLSQDKAQLHKMLSDRFTFAGSQWPPLVRELCEKTPNGTLTSWPFFAVPEVRDWRSQQGRVVVIGDAAHAIPPTGGQGAAMAFEDAETLSYALSRINRSFLAGPVDGNRVTLLEVLDKWQEHRHQRISNVMNFTSKNGALRKSSPHFYEQAAKEWIIWAAFKFMGHKAGAGWLYTYNAETVLSILA